jgi:hypothetical protein
MPRTSRTHANNVNARWCPARYKSEERARGGAETRKEEFTMRQ